MISHLHGKSRRFAFVVQSHVFGMACVHFGQFLCGRGAVLLPDLSRIHTHGVPTGEHETEDIENHAGLIRNTHVAQCNRTWPPTTCPRQFVNCGSGATESKEIVSTKSDLGNINII